MGFEVYSTVLPSTMRRSVKRNSPQVNKGLAWSARINVRSHRGQAAALRRAASQTSLHLRAIGRVSSQVIAD
jgi:hypothetical protein